jgi:hypothetical protein
MKQQNYNVVPPTVDSTVFGSKSGNTVNFNVQSLLALNATPEVVGTNVLTLYTITRTNTYFTGTASTSFAITMPAASSALDGAKYVVMSTTDRPSTTWISSGATFVGLPGSLVLNTPVCLQYNHSDTKWYISM